MFLKLFVNSWNWHEFMQNSAPAVHCICVDLNCLATFPFPTCYQGRKAFHTNRLLFISHFRMTITRKVSWFGAFTNSNGIWSQSSDWLVQGWQRKEKSWLSFKPSLASSVAYAKLSFWHQKKEDQVLYMRQGAFKKTMSTAFNANFRVNIPNPVNVNVFVRSDFIYLFWYCQYL